MNFQLTHHFLCRQSGNLIWTATGKVNIDVEVDGVTRKIPTSYSINFTVRSTVYTETSSEQEITLHLAEIGRAHV